MNIQEIKKIWEDVKRELEKEIPAHSYEPWILPLEPVNFEDNQFTLLTGQSIAKDYIKRQYYTQIIDAFKKTTGKDVILNIEFDEELAKKIKKERQNEEKRQQKEVFKE